MVGTERLGGTSAHAAEPLSRPEDLRINSSLFPRSVAGRLEQELIFSTTQMPVAQDGSASPENVTRFPGAFPFLICH